MVNISSRGVSRKPWTVAQKTAGWHWFGSNLGILCSSLWAPQELLSYLLDGDAPETTRMAKVKSQFPVGILERITQMRTSFMCRKGYEKCCWYSLEDIDTNSFPQECARRHVWNLGKSRELRWFAHKSVDGKLIGVQTCPDVTDKTNTEFMDCMVGCVFHLFFHVFIFQVVSIFWQVPKKNDFSSWILHPGYSQLQQILNGSEQLENSLHNKSWKDIGAQKRGGRLSVGADDFGGSFEDSRCDFVRLKFCSLKFKPWSYLVICCDLLRCTLQWAEQLLGRKVSSLQFVGCSGKLWRNVSSTTVWWIFSETPQLWPHKGNSTTPVTWVTGED